MHADLLCSVYCLSLLEYLFVTYKSILSLHEVSFTLLATSISFTIRLDNSTIHFSSFIYVSPSNWGLGGQEAPSSLTKEASRWGEWQPPSRQRRRWARWKWRKRIWRAGVPTNRRTHSSHQGKISGARGSEDRGKEEAAANQAHRLLPAELGHRERRQHRDLHPWSPDSTLNTYSGCHLPLSWPTHPLFRQNVFSLTFCKSSRATSLTHFHQIQWSHL